MKKGILKSSVSIIALCMMLGTAWGMQQDSYSDEEAETPKGRYSVGKDWDDKRSVASNAFSERSNRSAKKEELSYNEEDEWERGTERSNLEDIEDKSQKLTEITDLRKYFFKGNLEITSANYRDLSKYATFYATAFNTYDRGVSIKGWKASVGFDPLTELLHKFSQLKTFKVNINWDKEGDISETIARAIQFYESLLELDIANCGLTDGTMADIKDSIPGPEKLKVLDVSGNKLSKTTLTALKKHFPNLMSFKTDINLEMGKSLVPAVHSLSLKEKKETIEKSSAMEPIPQTKPNVTKQEEKQPYIPNASGIVNRPVVSDIVIPEIARGYEEIYRRFVMGKLIYKPDPNSDKGRIELPIRALSNPLEGTFDLSSCGDTGKYLSIAMGYRKGKISSNANKVEVWLAPRFLIEKNLKDSASHFKEIMASWDPIKAPIGLFFTWGSWDNLGWYDYLTSQDMESISSENLYKLDATARRTGSGNHGVRQWMAWADGSARVIGRQVARFICELK